MKTLIKSISSVMMVVLLTLFLVGCDNNPTEEKNTYDEKNYGLRYNFTYKETKTYAEAQEELKSALQALHESKSYSYEQKINGAFDDDIEYTGVTKINTTETTEASVELAGNLEFAMYVKGNKAYINNNGKKTCFEFESNGSNLDSLTSQVVGNLPSMFTFDESSFIKAGVDEYDVTIIEFSTNEEVGTVNLIIYKNKLQKVLYYDDNEITYVANYKYEEVKVIFPEDLDEYVAK